MANEKKRVPDWFDPLGLRGAIPDPLGVFGTAARMASATGGSFTWMLTAMARRLEGRQVEIRREPLIRARIAAVHEVVPTEEIFVPGLSKSIALWQRAAFSVDQVEVGGKPIEHVDLVATDVRIADSSAQVVSVGHVEMTVSVSREDLACWIDALAINVEVDLNTETVGVRPLSWFRWLRVIGRPELQARRVEVRATSVRIGRLGIPLPARLLKPRSYEIHQIPESLRMTGMRFDAGQRVKVELGGTDLEVAADIPRLITDIGVEGTMSVAKVLRP